MHNAMDIGIHTVLYIISNVYGRTFHDGNVFLSEVAYLMLNRLAKKTNIFV